MAGTRAGKGVSVVIPAIIDHDGPVAVLDIKGENSAVTLRIRRSLGRRVVVLNPFGVIEPSKDRSIRSTASGKSSGLLAREAVRGQDGPVVDRARMASNARLKCPLSYTASDNCPFSPQRRGA
ncbi:type IV secretory system conjugative DNA transfer family protein [Rhizobium azibense]|uniref:type IV secretory system conjugative DNA transfer family protein n=1 Tax=Rhizobium azibense TaxID=1136135 RepID=UPI00247A64F3|nr:type IV secretory system conjugative DNA transfer family protein [Rhizobium azibense]